MRVPSRLVQKRICCAGKPMGAPEKMHSHRSVAVGTRESRDAGSERVLGAGPSRSKALREVRGPVGDAAGPVFAQVRLERRTAARADAVRAEMRRFEV